MTDAATASLRAHAAEFHGYWGSGAAIIAVVLVLPKDPTAHLLRLLLTVGFFAGVITFLCAFLAPLRHYIEARTTVRYQAAGPAILHLARLADAATTQCVATVTLPLVVLASITAARVLAVWPEFSVLAPFASILSIAWWLSLLGWFGALFLRSGSVQDAIQKQALLREQLTISGYQPPSEDELRARDAQLEEAPVEILGEGRFRAGGFEWSFSDFQKNCVVFGQSGSGKTVCVLNALADGLLGSGSATHLPVGGLILDPKGDFRDKVRALCELHGRSADLLILDPSDAANTIRWNPFDSDDDELELASRFAAVLQTLGMKNEQDSYWIDSARTFVRHAIALLRNTGAQQEPPSFANILRLAASSVQGGGQTIAKGSFAEERILRIANDDDSGQLAVGYFIDTWATLAERTRSVVQSQIVNMIDPFLLMPYRELFSGRSTMRLSEVVESGKILYVYMPIADKELMSKTVCTLVKLEYFREVLKRPNKARPSFFLCDEFQSFFTVGAGKGDADFFERSRQSTHANVIATQNLPALLKQAGTAEVAVDNLLGNCSIKIFLRNTDTKTNEYASKLFGQQIDALANTSRSNTSPGAQGAINSSTSAQYAARVKEDEFMALAQPSATDAVPYAETIVQLASRATVATERLRWRIHPI